MAIGRFKVFDRFKSEMAFNESSISQGHTFVCVYLDKTWTPDLASQTGTANIVAAELTGSADTNLRQTLANVTWTSDGANVVAFDADDITMSDSALLAVKYVVIIDDDMPDDLLVGYFDLNSGDPSGTTINQLLIQWNASGIFTLRGGTAG